MFREAVWTIDSYRAQPLCIVVASAGMRIGVCRLRTPQQLSGGITAKYSLQAHAAHSITTIWLVRINFLGSGSLFAYWRNEDVKMSNGGSRGQSASVTGAATDAPGVVLGLEIA